MGNVFDVNIEGINENKYSIEIETANFSSLVSPNDGNRLSRTVEGGLFVPEIDFDLTSIYEEAKV